MPVKCGIRLLRSSDADAHARTKKTRGCSVLLRDCYGRLCELANGH